MRPTKMNPIEIKGSATLCFDESGLHFQGVIHAKDDTQYALYGTKVAASTARHIRRRSQAIAGTNNATEVKEVAPCGCAADDLAGATAVAYDIRIVDCEVGEEYTLRRVHGRNGERVTLRCEAITFSTTQVFKGQRADMEAQRVIGHHMEGVVYKGPIEVVAAHNAVSTDEDRPWLL